MCFCCVRTGCTEEGPTLHLCNPPDTGPLIIIPGPVPHSLMSGRKSGREREKEIERGIEIEREIKIGIEMDGGIERGRERRRERDT